MVSWESTAEIKPMTWSCVIWHATWRTFGFRKNEKCVLHVVYVLEVVKTNMSCWIEVNIYLRYIFGTKTSFITLCADFVGYDWSDPIREALIRVNSKRSEAQRWWSAFFAWAVAFSVLHSGDYKKTRFSKISKLNGLSIRHLQRGVCIVSWVFSTDVYTIIVLEPDDPSPCTSPMVGSSC